jgi:hypothetical protein
MAKLCAIEYLADAKLVLSEARCKDDNPMRRRLTARAHGAGVIVQPFVEIEFQSAALELAADGVADTLVARSHERANRVS